MKKVLSILLMGSMLGAPILSSNCSAYRIDGNVSTNINALVDEIYSSKNYFRNMYKSIIYHVLKNEFDDTNEINSSKRDISFHKARLEKAVNKILDLKEFDIDFCEIEELKRCYIEKLSEQEKKDLENYYKERIKNYYKELPIKDGSLDYSEDSKSSESTEYNDKEDIASKEDMDLNDNKENLNIDLGKDITAKFDEKATKKNKSPMFKIIVAGAVVAVVTYAGLIVYDMYYNQRSFMEANSNLLNTISNWSNSLYNCSSEYIKKFAESLKDYANKTYDYIKNNVTQTQLNQTISNTTGDAQVNQTIDDIKEILPIEEDYCDINDGFCEISDRVMESMEKASLEERENATESNFVEGVGVAGAVGGALATAGRFLSQHALSAATSLSLLGTIAYGIFYTYCAYQM